MILVDTSVWIDHFRNDNQELKKLLTDDEVICHPFIIGELACGNLKNRKEIIVLLQALSMVDTVENNEILLFIENHKLMGRGLGLIDVQLLSSALLNNVLLWTLDKKLKQEAMKLDIGYKY
ncbi:MAG: PIN domain-containing protein [Elusimicrobiota bacterium]